MANRKNKELRKANLSILFFSYFSVCQNAPTLNTITGGGIACHLGNSCTSINCCVDVPKLDMTLKVYFDLDVCSKEVTIGVEKFKRTISLYSFVFTQEDNFSFGGLVYIKYVSVENYILSVTV